MVYITGDMHGEFERFKEKNYASSKKEDTLIICGDFGFIWNGSKREQNTLKKIASLPYQIAFVDGCHENFDLLLSYPVEELEWCACSPDCEKYCPPAKGLYLHH